MRRLDGVWGETPALPCRAPSHCDAALPDGLGAGGPADGAPEALAAAAAAAFIFARTESRIPTTVPAIAVDVTMMNTTRIFPEFPPDGLDAGVDGEVRGGGEGVSMRAFYIVRSGPRQRA